MEVIQRATEIELVPLDQIQLNPKNRNKHPKSQIEALKKMIVYQGFRQPGTISNRTGFLVAGEGRYLALKSLGETVMAVMRQDFDDEAQEYAHGVADNALQKQAELDFAGINIDLGDLGPDFDVDLLGIKDFAIEVADKDVKETEPSFQNALQVNMPTEEATAELYEELKERGFDVKVLSL